MEENLNSIVEPEEETLNEEVTNEPEALAYDYYDRYYENVLSNMKTLIDNQTTTIEKQDDLIKKQDEIISQQKDIVLFCDCFILLFSIYFIYTYIRNMLNIKRG